MGFAPVEFRDFKYYQRSVRLLGRVTGLGLEGL